MRKLPVLGSTRPNPIEPPARRKRCPRPLVTVGYAFEQSPALQFASAIAADWCARGLDGGLLVWEDAQTPTVLEDPESLPEHLRALGDAAGRVVLARGTWDQAPATLERAFALWGDGAAPLIALGNGVSGVYEPLFSIVITDGRPPNLWNPVARACVRRVDLELSDARIPVARGIAGHWGQSGGRVPALLNRVVVPAG